MPQAQRFWPLNFSKTRREKQLVKNKWHCFSLSWKKKKEKKRKKKKVDDAHLSNKAHTLEGNEPQLGHHRALGLWFVFNNCGWQWHITHNGSSSLNPNEMGLVVLGKYKFGELQTLIAKCRTFRLSYILDLGVGQAPCWGASSFVWLPTGYSQLKQA